LLQVQVYLMINYLGGYYNGGARGPVQIRLPHPKYAILSFWENRTIRAMGQKRTPHISKDAWLFSQGYIEVYVNNCNDPDPQWTIDNCGAFVADLYKRRDEIIQRHIDEIVPVFRLIEEGKGKKINPKKELKCFDKTKPAKITIYVKQPIPNSREITADIGHTFIGIEQDGISRYFGFYPDSPGATLVGDKSQPAEIRDNSGSPFDVSISTTVTSAQLTKIINDINNFPEIYRLEEYINPTSINRKNNFHNQLILN